MFHVRGGQQKQNMHMNKKGSDLFFTRFFSKTSFTYSVHCFHYTPCRNERISPRKFEGTLLTFKLACIPWAGEPVMADVDSVSQNITAETIAAVLTPRTKGIVVVHLAGWPCDMDPIMKLSREKGLWVVEDCAQANGATYKGRQVGSMGDVSRGDVVNF